jgi:hypothetical protein
MPPIRVPNVEMLAVQYLKSALTAYGHSVTVATNVPATRPAELVKITVTGGELRDLVITDAQLAVECWAATPLLAGDLARDAQALLGEWTGQKAGDSFIYDCRARMPASFPDPDSRTPRYIFTAQVTLRAIVGTAVYVPEQLESGDGPPPSSGVPGATYLDETTGNLYQYSAGS